MTEKVEAAPSGVEDTQKGGPGEAERGGAHAEADGHGAPDKSPRQTEERPTPQRAEVSNYFEWVQNLQHFRWDEREVNDRLGRIMRKTYNEVSTRAHEHDLPMRTAAYELGIEPVVDAARTRGYIG